MLVRDAGGWMPIYEYKCENVHVFDVMQKLFDAPWPRASSAALRSGRLCNR
jgi:predicted nucleic acid-binding Zn ribbon protein